MANERYGMGSAGDALAELFSGPLGAGLAPAARAARAWYSANGDRERRHTTGVWLRKSGKAGIADVLVVALDSNLLAAELGTNRDLYLGRLSQYGIAVSDIRFTVRKGTGKGRKKEATAAKAGVDTSSTPLPPLSSAEEQRVERACAELPDGLKQSVSRAMCASLRRSKTTHT